MNKLFFLLGLMALVSCSQKKEDVITQVKPEEVISYNAGVGIFTGSGDFGEVKKTDAKVLTLKITNSGDAPLQGPPSIDNTNFSIIYQNGCASVAPTKACTVKVTFDAKGKPTGQEYEANFNLDSAFIALSASIAADITPPAEESVDFLSGSAVISLQDFGETAQNKNILKTISIKNKGSLPISSTVALSGSSAYSISYDACSGKSIAKNSSCIMKVNFASGTLSGAITGSLTYNGKSLSLSGTVTPPVATSGSPSIPGTPYYQIAALVNNTEQTSIDGGVLRGSESKQIIINLKNLGNTTSPSASAILDNSHASIAYNQCANKTLAPNASCQIRVLLSASGKANNSYSSLLSFGDKSLNINFLVTSPTAVITYQPNYSEYGNCSAALACEGEGVKSRSLISCQKLSDGTPIPGGQLSDCSSFNIPSNLDSTCQSPAGTITSNIQGGIQNFECLMGSSTQSFVSVSCENGYFVDGQICSPDVISYIPTYSQYSACSASICGGSGNFQDNSTVKAAPRNAAYGYVSGSQYIMYFSDYMYVFGTDPASTSLGTYLTTTEYNAIAVGDTALFVNASNQGTVISKTKSGSSIEIRLTAPVSGSYSGAVAFLKQDFSYQKGNQTTGIKTRNIIDCKKITNGIELSASIADCDNFATLDNLESTCSSPAGTMTVPILGGTQQVSCSEGSNNQEYVTSSTICSGDYILSSNSQSCVYNPFTPTLLAFSSSYDGTSPTNKGFYAANPSISMSGNRPFTYQVISGVVPANQLGVKNSSYSSNNYYTGSLVISLIGNNSNKQTINILVTDDLGRSKTLSAVVNMRDLVVSATAMGTKIVSPSNPVTFVTSSKISFNANVPVKAYEIKNLTTNTILHTDNNYSSANGTPVLETPSEVAIPLGISEYQITVTDLFDNQVSYQYSINRGNFELNNLFTGADGNLMCGTTTGTDIPYCWGNMGSFFSSAIPKKLVDSAVSAIGVGQNHVCYITKPNGKLFCFGSNNVGQLGNGTNTNAAISAPVAVMSSYSFKEVGAGTNHTCAIRSDDLIFCWGQDGLGQLGRGSTLGDTTLPVQISSANGLTTAKGLSVGIKSCAIRTSDNLAFCWGGIIANGTYNWTSNPTPFSEGIAVKSISTGVYHTCVLRNSDSYVLCKGDAANGQLGNGSTTFKVAFTALSAPFAANPATQLYSTYRQGYAITANEELYAWGINNNSQIGLANTTAFVGVPLYRIINGSHSPAHDINKVTKVVGNINMTCAISKGDKKTYCWGKGRIGNGNTDDNLVNATATPITVPIN